MGHKFKSKKKEHAGKTITPGWQGAFRPPCHHRWAYNHDQHHHHHNFLNPCHHKWPYPNAGNATGPRAYQETPLAEQNQPNCQKAQA